MSANAAAFRPNDGGSALPWGDLGPCGPAALEPDRLDRLLQQALASGGDERIRPDPATGRTRYGTPVAPAPDEIWLSSSTATGISPAGYDAARQALRAVLQLSPHGDPPPAPWFDALRNTLLALYGSKNAEVVLSPSGTDGELIALAIADRLLDRPITNILVAPGETGSSVPTAAAGRHFQSTSPLGGAVEAGSRIQGWEREDIEVEAVEIRTPDGEGRPAEAVDRDVAVVADRALARGRGVLLHVLDSSKTGLPGVTRQAAADLRGRAPGRVLVVVDACQLRCPPERLRVDLERGFAVLMTGSKFVAGPPFAGALLLPEAIHLRLRESPPLPEGLRNYSAQHDWPVALHSTFARDLRPANLGLGLRWTAALAEIKRLTAVSMDLQEAILAHFASEVGHRAAAVPFAGPIDLGRPAVAGSRSIVPLAVQSCGGAPVTATAAAMLHRALRMPVSAYAAGGPVRDCLRAIVHVGQPVTLGQQSILRVCASASHVADIGERVAAGSTLWDAFAPLARSLDTLFAKWTALAEGGGY